MSRRVVSQSIGDGRALFVLSEVAGRRTGRFEFESPTPAIDNSFAEIQSIPASQNQILLASRSYSYLKVIPSSFSNSSEILWPL